MLLRPAALLLARCVHLCEPMTRVHTLTTAGAVLATLIGLPLHGENWTMYLHDARHSSASLQESPIAKDTIAQLQPVWSTSTGNLVAAAPSILGAMLYVGDWKGFFYAIDAAS